MRGSSHCGGAARGGLLLSGTCSSPGPLPVSIKSGPAASQGWVPSGPRGIAVYTPSSARVCGPACGRCWAHPALRDTPVLAGVVIAESSGEGSKGRAELRAVGTGTVGLLWSLGDHGPLFPDASCMLLSSGTFRMICLIDHSPTGHKDSFGLLW